MSSFPAAGDRGFPPRHCRRPMGSRPRRSTRLDRIISPKPVPEPLQLRDEIKRLALQAGFDLAGVAGVDQSDEHRFFPEWIAAGRAGDMHYLEARSESGELKRALSRGCSSVGAFRGGLRHELQRRPAILYPRRIDLAGLDLALRLPAARLPRRAAPQTAPARSRLRHTVRTIRRSKNHAPGAMSIPALSSSASSPNMRASAGSAKTRALSTSSLGPGCFSESC